MTDNGKITTVMDPAAFSSTSISGQVLSASVFWTNVTSKCKYQDSLWRWIRMITSCASTDSKYKSITTAAGHVVHAFCDDTAQNLIWQSDLLGLIDMDGNDYKAKKFQPAKTLLTRLQGTVQVKVSKRK